MTESVPALLKELDKKLDASVAMLDDATPGQAAKLAATCITALAHAGHRQQSESGAKVVTGALTRLVRQVQKDLMDTDPGDCAALEGALAEIEFQHRVREVIRNQKDDEEDAPTVQ
jgi:hypothetical protein